MKSQEISKTQKSAGRGWLRLSAFLVFVFVCNVFVRMLNTKAGFALWRFPDAGEFLLVLAAMSFFVLGILALEEKR